MELARACFNALMTALWLLIPLALIVLAPLLGTGDMPYRERRGSWRNYS
jgi:hypothetical protein